MEQFIYNASMPKAEDNLSHIARSFKIDDSRHILGHSDRTILTSRSKVQCIECRRWFPMKEMIELDILGSGEYMCQDCKGDD